MKRKTNFPTVAEITKENNRKTIIKLKQVAVTDSNKRLNSPLEGASTRGGVHLQLIVLTVLEESLEPIFLKISTSDSLVGSPTLTGGCGVLLLFEDSFEKTEKISISISIICFLLIIKKLVNY